MVAVNVNPLYTARELEHQLKDSGAEAIVIFANSANVLEKVISNTPVKHVMVTQIGDLLKFPKNYIVNFVLKYVKKMVPDYSLPGSINFVDALANGDFQKFTPVEVSHEDTAFLQYTGGTTGVSKGAVLTHKNIISNLLQARAWIKNFITEGGETNYPSTLSYLFTYSELSLFFKYWGNQCLITNPRDFKGFVKELSKWNFTAITGVNTLFNAS